MAVAYDIRLTGNPEIDQFITEIHGRLLPVDGVYYYSFYDNSINGSQDVESVTNEDSKTMVRQVLQNISNVIGIKFKECDYSASDIGGFDIASGNYPYPNVGGASMSNTHASVTISYLNDYVSSAPQNSMQNYLAPVPKTVAHEVLHLLGFYDGLAWNPAYTGVDAVMSYNSVTNVRENAWVYVRDENGNLTGEVLHAQNETLGIYDIQALQSIYGANHDYNADDTTYKYSPGTLKNFHTIWDGGGVDTIDVSDFVLGVDLNLNGGTRSNLIIRDFSYNDDEYDGTRAMGIAYGANIENAIGGMGDDTIKGNELDNIINGGLGSDTLYGGAGWDSLYGGDGNDTLYGDSGNDRLYGEGGVNILYGGDGNDYYYVDVGSLYTIVEDITGGDADWFVPKGQLMSDTTFYMPENIETADSALLYSFNGAKWTIIGNDSDNSMIGRIYTGDILGGGKGNDFMQAYSGSDTYLFNRGDGQDTILEYNNLGMGAGDTDRLLFGDNIDANQLWFNHVAGLWGEQNLVISILGSEDQVTLRNWYEDGRYQQNCKLEEITTKDGVTFNIEQVEELVGIMENQVKPSTSYTSIIDDYLAAHNTMAIV